MKEYIYYLICPIENKVRYVGKTKNPKSRYKQHISKLDKLITPKRKWLESLFEKKLLPIMKIVEETTVERGREREQYHVELHKDTILNIHNPGKGMKSFEGKYPKKINYDKGK